MTLFPLIVIVYVLLARSEEKRVLQAFGDEYSAYQRRVPMFCRGWASGAASSTGRAPMPRPDAPVLRRSGAVHCNAIPDPQGTQP